MSSSPAPSSNLPGARERQHDVSAMNRSFRHPSLTTLATRACLSSVAITVLPSGAATDVTNRSELRAGIQSLKMSMPRRRGTSQVELRRES